ncbi:ribose 5-phosphate isomerase B [Bacteroidetes oral taxon 274 str. F0058]|nr:ribose 5-phosphate isomerase B [Bacteroidetes oral taxon 274 str. F0058]
MTPINLMSIGVASDHAGYELKTKVIKHLESKGCVVHDFGTDSAESVDYPDYAHKLASAVESGSCQFGIAICGSGNGVNMTVNHHRKVRGALCWTPEIAALARQHNDANIISLPARFIEASIALQMVDVFLSTDFEGGRHQRRVEKIDLA